MDFDLYRGLPVLVTGGAGFIGSHLVRGLHAAGAHVLVLDNFCNSSPDNLRELESEIGIMTGDITLPEDCQRAVRDRSVVFHLAALGSVPGSVDAPIKYNNVNINGTLNMLEAARQAGAQRFVYSASSSAYGDTPTLPKVETMPANPKSPYAVGKTVGEFYARVYAEVYKMSTVSLRYFNVFGPRQNPKSQYAAVIPAFITSLLRGIAPKIYGDGQQTRDFCYVANVVHANMLAGICNQPLKGEVVNVACGQNVSLNDLLAKLQRLTGASGAPTYLPARAGDVRDSLADIGAVTSLLGYKPLVYLDEGLEKAVAWYRENTHVK
jgi:nucleoside-diphosphate-sugar epimerase